MRFRTGLTAIALGSLLATGLLPITTAPTAAAQGRLAAHSRLATPTAVAGPIGAVIHAPACAAHPTTTSLRVSPSTGAPHQSVTLTVTVSSSAGAPLGAVTIRDGATLLARGVVLHHGSISVTTNALGAGTHSLSAQFTGAVGWQSSTSPVVVAVFGRTDAPAGGTVAVSIPAGALTITSPRTGAYLVDVARAGRDRQPRSARPNRVDVVITDTRPGNRGFTATVVAGRLATADGRSVAASHVGLVDLAVDQVPNNALHARDVRVADTKPNAPGLGAERVFARYPAGISLGTTRIHGLLAVAGLPSSTPAGRYATTLTFTAF